MSILYVKLAIGVLLLTVWLLLEYVPPKSTDVDSMKELLKTVLIGLAGNLLPGGTQ